MQRILGRLVLAAALWFPTTLVLAFEEADAPARAPNQPAAAREAALPAWTEAQWEDPRAVTERFSRELGRLVEKEETVSPADLAEAASQIKTCAVRTAGDPGVKRSAEEIYRQACRSVVVVGGISKRKESGWNVYCAAGFVLRKDGVVATNQHVITAFGEMTAIGVMTRDGNVFPVQKVLAADKSCDVAVIQIRADGLAPLPVAPDVSVGAAVWCLSHPALNSAKTENAFYAFTQGAVSGKYRLRSGGGRPVDVLAITADYAVGSSGGPILNEHGAVVGMVCETLPIFSGARSRDVQMVWKFARPSGSLLRILRAEGTRKSVQ